MDQHTFDALAGRIERLERENRRLGRIGAVVVAGAVAVALVGAKQGAGPGEVRATRFVLVGDDGDVLGRWEPSPRGASLELRGVDGKSRLDLGFPRRALPPDRALRPGLFDDRGEALPLDQVPQPEIYFRDREGEVVYISPPRLEVIPAR